MKRLAYLWCLLLTFVLAACNNTQPVIDENIDEENSENVIEETDVTIEDEYITFSAADSLESLDAKWHSYVEQGIMLEQDNCDSYVFASENSWKYYWAYKCQQPSQEEWYTDTLRSGILDLFVDERVLTCVEANGEQWVGYNQELYWEYQNDKTCAELEEYLESVL